MTRTSIRAISHRLHNDWLVTEAARCGLTHAVVCPLAPSAVAAWMAQNVTGGRRVLRHPNTGATTYCFASHVEAMAFKMQFG